MKPCPSGDATCRFERRSRSERGAVMTFSDSHRLDPLAEDRAVRGVAVTQQKTRRFIAAGCSWLLHLFQFLPVGMESYEMEWSLRAKVLKDPNAGRLDLQNLQSCLAGGLAPRPLSTPPFPRALPTPSVEGLEQSGAVSPQGSASAAAEAN